jgi:cobalt-zinc-cadmium efflux system outer membrane protein
MRVGLNPARNLICLIAAAVSSAGAQSIDEFVQRALSSNRDYLASLQQVRQAAALLRGAGVRPAPAVEVEGGSTRLLGAPGSQEYSIAYVHTLETGGKRSKRLEVARLGLERAKSEADERKRQLTLEVRQRYAEALNARRRLAVLVDAARVNEETLRLITARVEEGDAAPLEKRLLETDLNRAEVDRVLIEAKLRTALLQLRRIGALAEGNPPQDSLPAMPAPPASRDELVRRALGSRSDLRVLQAAEEAARSGVVLAQSDSSPNVSASARYSYRSATFDQFGFDNGGALTPIRDRESILSFGVSVPLFSARRNQANVAASVAREHEARLRREYLAGAIPSEVAVAFEKWDASRKALDVFDRKILPNSEQNLNVIRQAWQLGQLRFLDVLNEQRRLVDLRLARADAETDIVTAWAELEHAVGGDTR